MKKGLARFATAVCNALSGFSGVIILMLMCQGTSSARSKWVAKDFVLAVHAGEERTGTYPRSYLERLADEMHKKLKACPGFRVVERKDLKRRMKQCLAGRSDVQIRQKCRTLVGSEIGAQKGFAINIEKQMGLVCRLNIVLFDQMSGAGNRWYGGTSACEFDDFMGVVEVAVERVASERSDGYAVERTGKTDAEIEIRLAQMLERDKRYKEAMQHLRLAEEMSPSWKLPVVMQAELAGRMNDLELSRSIYRRLLEISKNDPVFCELVRRAILKTGQSVGNADDKRARVDFWVISELPIQEHSMDVSAADDGSVLIVGQAERAEEISHSWVEKLGNLSEISRQILVIKLKKGGEVDWIDRSEKAEGGDRYSGVGGPVVEALPGGASLVGGGFDGSVTLGFKKKSKTVLSTKEDYSAFLARYSNDGKIEWVWTPNNKGFAIVDAIAGTPDQGCLVVGRIRGELIIAGKKYKSMKEWTEIFVVRIEKNGTPVWARIVPHDGEWSLSTLTPSIAIDVYEDGSSVLMTTLEKDVVVGSTRGRRPRRCYLFRFDPEGKQTWSKSYENEWIEGYDVAASPDGSLLLSGQLSRALKLKGSGALIPEKYPDAFVARIDSSGDAVWGYRLGSVCCYDRGRGIEVAADGTFVWLGWFDGNATKGGKEVEDVVLVAKEGMDFLVQGFNRNGKPRWWCHGHADDKTTNYHGLDISPQNNVAVIGNTLSQSTRVDCGHGSSTVVKGKGVFVVGISQPEK